MQHVNGYANPNVIPAAAPTDDESSPRSARRHPPAYETQAGRVVTRIWADPNHWGEITWRIDQYRSHSSDAGAGRYRSFHPSDLNDAMRGLYRAQRWVRRAERRRRWRRWW